MRPAVLLTTAAAGLFFLVGLLAGVWKWRAMLARPDHRAPAYVDTAHRASLLYSFASLVLLEMLKYSPFPAWVEVLACAGPLAFFGLAIAMYALLGLVDRTDNQFRSRNFFTTTGMVLLAAVEIGGFVTLFAGCLWTMLRR